MTRVCRTTPLHHHHHHHHHYRPSLRSETQVSGFGSQGHSSQAPPPHRRRNCLRGSLVLSNAQSWIDRQMFPFNLQKCDHDTRWLSCPSSAIQRHFSSHSIYSIVRLCSWPVRYRAEECQTSAVTIRKSLNRSIIYTRWLFARSPKRTTHIYNTYSFISLLYTKCTSQWQWPAVPSSHSCTSHLQFNSFVRSFCGSCLWAHFPAGKDSSSQSVSPSIRWVFCFCLCNSHRLCFCHSSACNALLGFFLFFFFFVSFCLAFVILVAWPNQGRDSGRDSGLAVRSLARSFVRALFWFWLLLYDVSGCNNNNTYITLNALAERLPPFLHTYIHIY